MSPLPTTHNHLLIKAVYLWVTASTERETRAERLGVLLQHPFIPRATLPPSSTERETRAERLGVLLQHPFIPRATLPPCLHYLQHTTICYGLRGRVLLQHPSPPGTATMLHYYNTQPSVNKSCISLGDSQHRARDIFKSPGRRKLCQPIEL
ncbi:hypothetical protein J6590_011245 [Homalodisca vitripennis]|nr:hypothetical protein J6590_011245 [Homalodisca vitripennis]